MGVVNGLVTMRFLKFFGLSDFYYSAIVSSMGLPIFLYLCLSLEVILNASSGGYSKYNLWTSILFNMLWMMVNSGFCLLGAYRGYMLKRIMPQVRVDNLHRPIPEQPKYLGPVFTALFFGFIQYLAICVEFSSIMQSIWRARMYSMFWFLLVDVILLVVVIGLLSVIQTYLQLQY